MITQAVSKGSRGRLPRYGVNMASLHVRFPPALLARVREDAALRQVREPEEHWSASRVAVEAIARFYGFDLTNSES